MPRHSIPIWGEMTSGTAGSGLTEPQQRFTLWKSVDGVPTQITSLDADDIVEITDITLYAVTSSLILTVFSGADNIVDAGEAIAKANLVSAASTTVHIPLPTVPGKCKPGTFPKLYSSGAATYNGCIKGRLSKVYDRQT